VSEERAPTAASAKARRQNSRFPFRPIAAVTR
jgi:hypothetical protein